MQTDNPFLDGLAKVFTDAAGAAQSVRAEIDSFVKQRLEKLVADMDFVPREEFEAVKAMAAKARSRERTARSAHRRAGAVVPATLKPTHARPEICELLFVSKGQCGRDSCHPAKSCVRLTLNCFVLRRAHSSRSQG